MPDMQHFRLSRFFFATRIQKPKGFTLTELAIVLGVMGAILGVVWIAASNVYLKQKTDDAMLELNTVTQNVLSVWQGRTFPAGITMSTFITSKIIPDWAVTSPTTASDPWNSTGFTIAPTSLTGGPPRAFAIKFANVPAQACVIMVTQGAACSFGQSGCPASIIVTPSSTGAAMAPLPGTGITTWQLTTEAIAQTCTNNGAAGSTVNSIEFDYSL
jgi:prepilin-type N-terminal cleavage/methylation domain-containing protein